MASPSFENPCIKTLPLDSRIFTVTVGTGENMQTLNMHASVLCKSKVFRCMCEPNFREGVTGHIDLPEDSPQVFRVLAHFLYNGDYKMVSGVPAKMLGDIYVMADKYDMQDLKKNTLEKLKEVINTKILTDDYFYELVELVYNEMGSVDYSFREFYKDEGKRRYASHWGALKPFPAFMTDWIKGGGQLAVDTAGIVIAIGDDYRRTNVIFNSLRPKLLQSIASVVGSMHASNILESVGWPKMT